MSVQDVVKKAVRTDRVLAVQYVAGNADSEAAIRGWMPSFPADEELEKYLNEGVWLIKRRDSGEIYFVTDEQYQAEFTEESA